MKKTGTKLTRIAAGDAAPTTTKSTAIVAARLYAGATLDVAMMVASKRFRVLVLSCETTCFP